MCQSRSDRLRAGSETGLRLTPVHPTAGPAARNGNSHHPIRWCTTSPVAFNDQDRRLGSVAHPPIPPNPALVPGGDKQRRGQDNPHHREQHDREDPPASHVSTSSIRPHEQTHDDRPGSPLPSFTWRLFQRNRETADARGSTRTTTFNRRPSAFICGSNPV
jgi:hypothetical protein